MERKKKKAKSHKETTNRNVQTEKERTRKQTQETNKFNATPIISRHKTLKLSKFKRASYKKYSNKKIGKLF